MNSLAIGICATKNYSYAVNAQAIAVQSAIFEYLRAKKIDSLNVYVILASDGCEKMLKLEEKYSFLLNSPKIKLTIHKLIHDIDDNNSGYKEKAQKIIALLRTSVFTTAKSLGVDYCWSLDSDVLPKANCLIAMEDSILFDNSYYSVACCPYPSQGGGPFLCGRGTHINPILKDIYPEEKNVSKKILKRIQQIDNSIAKQTISIKKLFSFEAIQRLRVLHKKRHLWNVYIDKKVANQTSNVFSLNSKGWRKRGWFDFAYPGIGKGALVPTDWCGFGCNLINNKALNYIDFHGYEGKGTEDLFIVWNRWFPNGIKLVAVPHCPADHVIRKRVKKSKENVATRELVHIVTSHEPDGEFEGHLRQDHKQFTEYF